MQLPAIVAADQSRGGPIDPPHKNIGQSCERLCKAERSLSSREPAMHDTIPCPDKLGVNSLAPCQIIDVCGTNVRNLGFGKNCKKPGG